MSSAISILLAKISNKEPYNIILKPDIFAWHYQDIIAWR